MQAQYEMRFPAVRDALQQAADDVGRMQVALNHAHAFIASIVAGDFDASPEAQRHAYHALARMVDA